MGGAGGNVAIVGAPQSGKSTALQYVDPLLALAEDRDPVEIGFDRLDFGGAADCPRCKGSRTSGGSVAGSCPIASSCWSPHHRGPRSLCCWHGKCASVITA